MTKKKIAVFTGGGDCPGLNNAIKQIVTSAKDNYEVEAITEGWEGAVQMALKKNPEIISIYAPQLNETEVRRIDREGGTMLMSSRANPFKYENKLDNIHDADVSEEVFKFLNERYHAVIAIGGEDTLGAAGKLAKKGLRIIGVPKTIDKDLCGTQFTLGFDSALNVGAYELSKLRSSAGSHGMVYFVEIMGRRAGHLTYHAGVASHVHFMTIPEVETDMDRLFQLIDERRLKEKYPGYHRDGRRYTIVAVAEGTSLKGIGEVVKSRRLDPHSNPVLGKVAEFLVKEYTARTGDENARDQALRYLPRSGEPSSRDRTLGQYAGLKALELIANEQFGRMVTLGLEGTGDIPLMDVVGKIRVLDAQKCFDAQNYKPILNDLYFHEREIPK